MDGLILAAGKNRPGENDSTGAFQLAANQFKAINGVSSAPIFFDNSGEEAGSYQAVRERVLKAVREGGSSVPWDAVAIFCHGGANALWSAGLIGATGAQALADEIRPRAAAGLTVILYACNAGSPGGFASLLAANLADLNARVFGHTSARHTYANPDTTVFPGGDWVIAKSSPLWKNWNDDIIDQSNDLWARFPFMTQEALEAELSAPEFLLGRWKVGTKPNFWNNVFFSDATVVQTGAAVDLKFAIYDSGKWSADAHKVTVTWDSGTTDTWALHLSPHGQHVRVGGNGTGPTNHLATRIEAPNVNDRGQFQPSGGRGDESAVAYA
jgi:hypothetical protein